MDITLWWDESGPFVLLHRFNKIRLTFIQTLLKGNIEGVNVLDVGCSAGLLSEGLSRLGAHVTGIDKSPKAINMAREHSSKEGLKIGYEVIDLLHGYEGTFDLVVASEVIEHVEDQELFLKNLSLLVKPGGLLVISTLNKTVMSRVFALFMAEYILGIVPRGTHCFDLLVSPQKIELYLGACGFQMEALQGLSYSFLKREWRFSKNLWMNYIMALKATTLYP